jgi:hypothetical protein
MKSSLSMNSESESQRSIRSLYDNVDEDEYNQASQFLKTPRRIVKNNHLMVNRSRSFQAPSSYQKQNDASSCKRTAPLLARNSQNKKNSFSVEQLQSFSGNSSSSHSTSNNCFSFGSCSSNQADNSNFQITKNDSLYVKTLRRIRKISRAIRKSNSFSRG